MQELVAETSEIVLEPDLEIVDSHHHLWESSFLGPGISAYLLPDFLRDVDAGHRVTKSVYVEGHAMYRADGPEAMRPLGEVEFANGIAAMSASGLYGPSRLCAAIVGHADLRLGDGVDAVLEAQEMAAGGRFRGIRYSAAMDDDPVVNLPQKRPAGLYLDSKLREGLARLEARGLSFDAWLFHTQLSDVVDLARAFPNLSIIMNHAGGPLRIGGYADRLDDEFQHWRKGILALAECPNVVIKLGGVGMRFFGLGEGPHSSEFLAAQWGPYFSTCIEAFGPDRCMFESNFPVDRLSCDYIALWNSFKRITAAYSADEKASMYHDTAARIYHL